MNPEMAGRAQACEQHFNTLFATYFDGMEARLNAPPFSRFTPQCVQLLRELSLRGGKRMRVVVLHEAARLITGEPVQALDTAALSIELLQTHGLIHDDLIDDSPTRRGGPSTYYAYRDQFPHHPHTALGLTVLAGDLALALSLQVLLEADLPAALRQAMVQVQTRTAADTIVGQIIDIERDFTTTPDQEMLHSVADYKSARYSVLAPLQLGLLAAGGQPAPVESELRTYARLVGIAGQMRDDYLDIFGDPAVMGKPCGTDLREGKHNYTVHALLAATEGDERRTVQTALEDRACPPHVLAALQDIARRHGVPDRMQADMRHYARQASALAATWRPRWRHEAVAFFEQLPLWGIERVK